MSKKLGPEGVLPDYTQVAQRAVEAAQRAGATQADAYCSAGRETTIKINKGQVEELTQAGSKALGVRVLVDGRTACLHTSDFSAAAVRKLAKDAVALAKHSSADPFAGIPERTGKALAPPKEMDLFDPAIPAEPVDAKIDRAVRCEAAAAAVSKKIENSQGTTFADRLGAVCLASSNGFLGRYAGTRASMHTIPIAVEKGGRQTDYWFTTSRFLDRLEDPEEVGRIAAVRSLARLNAEKPDTGEMPVVFDPQAAATLVGHWGGAASGGAVFREQSFLRGRLKEVLGPAGFHLVDDPTLDRGLASHPFDGEGMPAKKNAIFKDGKLLRYLTDSYAARKLKKPLTHSAGRGVGGGPGVSTSNLYLAAGPHSFEEIMGSVDRGVYVTSFMGHGVNLVTGDYSRGATGFLIEKGQLTKALQGFTIAGNLLQMLADVEMIGDDLEFRSSTASPTLKISKMMVAGK